MSSAGIPGGETVGAVKQYFCYQCDGYINIRPPSSPTAEIVCPNCQGGFLEESEAAPPSNPNNPSPDPNPNPFFTDDFPADIPFGGFPFAFPPSSAAQGATVFSFPSGGGGRGGGGGGSGIGEFEDLSSLFGAPSPNDFNPFAFLNNYLNNLQARGANIQLVFESPGGGGIGGGGVDFRLPANLGDYFMGPGLEQLIQQLAENDPNRYGTPPTSKSVVEGLPDINITEQMLASDSSQCAVCKDSFELNEVAKQIPCKHIYHKDCILPWLELHNSCPVCRFELPTDDPDYESRRAGQMNENSSRDTRSMNLGFGAGGGSQENRGNNSDINNNSPQTPRTLERRFRIALPWLFRGLGSPAETSNSGADAGNSDGGNNNPNQGGSGAPNSGSGGRGGGQAREEDLD